MRARRPRRPPCREYEFGTGVGQQPPFGRTLNKTILVPFPPESCLSGIGATPPSHYSWYRLLFDDPFPAPARPIDTWLHFGAVDWNATVWLNRVLIANHSGGYTHFTAVATGLRATGNELIVRAFDPSDAGFQVNGKQRISAINNPGGDTYTPSSGIWQTVRAVFGECEGVHLHVFRDAERVRYIRT